MDSKLETYVKIQRIQANMIEQLYDRTGELVYVRDYIDDAWSGPYQLLSVTSNNYAFETDKYDWRFAKLAEHTTRRVIASRRKLVEVLLEQGFLPSTNGTFVNSTMNVSQFHPQMWELVGRKVRKSGIFYEVIDANMHNVFHIDWTELVPEEN